ncbi:MAG: DEAD/DEAH box helicase [Candidatus Moduliflexus flocculans]|nr:DEAD/DEAH box helicase [Candidatus Moduliflexus flocculans]
MEFSNFDLHPHVAAGVKAIGYLTPTPIQEQAIPPVLKGHDVMGLAQTGTGKTAAFALPILRPSDAGTARPCPRPHRRARRGSWRSRSTRSSPAWAGRRAFGA